MNQVFPQIDEDSEGEDSLLGPNSTEDALSSGAASSAAAHFSLLLSGDRGDTVGPGTCGPVRDPAEAPPAWQVS